MQSASPGIGKMGAAIAQRLIEVDKRSPCGNPLRDKLKTLVVLAPRGATARESRAKARSSLHPHRCRRVDAV